MREHKTLLWCPQD